MGKLKLIKKKIKSSYKLKKNDKVDLYNFNLGVGANTTSLNGNGSGFFNITTASVGKTSADLPDYRRFYRKCVRNCQT